MTRSGWEDRCRLCGSRENLEYCSMCGYHFCATCKKNYPARVEAMMREKSQDLAHAASNFLRSFLGK